MNLNQRAVDGVLTFFGVLIGLFVSHVLWPEHQEQSHVHVWQEMPKMAWQKSDGSTCDIGYSGECSLLEAGSVTVSVNGYNDAGQADYDWSSMCACRVVRAK